MREYAVAFENTTIMNGDFRMENVDYKFEKGYVTAVVGGNGSGKSTLLQAMAGMHSVGRGRILVGGYHLHEEPEKAKNQIGFVFHKCPFKENLTPELCGKIFGPFYETFDFVKFRKMCENMNVEYTKQILYFSKGQKVKLQLAFAVAHEAKIYLLDDALEGLDPVFRRETKKLLAGILADGEHTVIMATKNQEDMEKFVDFTIDLGERKEVDDDDEISMDGIY